MSQRKVPPWATVTTLALCGVVTSLQFTLVLPMLPVLPQILSVTPDDASWVVTATLVASAVATPVLTRMADMYGKRLLLLVALAAMVIGSAMVALGSGFATVLVGRSMQGCASALVPVGISLLRDTGAGGNLASVVALMSATLGVGAAFGLPLSGVLYEALGWESIFWLSAMAGTVLIGAVALLVPESALRSPARFDFTGTAMLAIMIVATLLIISKGSRWGWTSPLVLTLAVTAATVTAAWIPAQLRKRESIVDLRLAVSRPIFLTNTASLFVTIAMFANIIVTMQQVQTPTAAGHGFGLSVAAAGLALLPSGVITVAIAPLAGMLLNRWGGKAVLAGGSVLMTVALGLRPVLDRDLLSIIVGSSLVSVGVSLAFAAMPTLIMTFAPVTETAAANGINTLVRALGMAICSAGLAVIAANMSVLVDGVDVLPRLAIQLSFWLAALSALVATLLTLLIRDGRPWVTAK